MVIQQQFCLELKKSNEESEQKIVANLKDSLPDDVDYRRVEFVGPKVGKELKFWV